MRSRARPVMFLGVVMGLTALLAGCPLEFEKEARQNMPPRTIITNCPGTFDFATGVCRPITFADQVSFSWLGTDLDNDVVAYQYQLVQTDLDYYRCGDEGCFDEDGNLVGPPGNVIRSIDPFAEFPDSLSNDEKVIWTDRVTVEFQAFAGLLDGWYEMRIRAIDEKGAVSEPVTYRFEVFFDNIPPTPSIVPPPDSPRAPCGRIGQQTSWTFYFTATDFSRRGETPRTLLEYSYRLRAKNANNCNTHLADQYTDWTFFPAGDEPILVGNQPPTLYTDLFDPLCGWEFTVRVRDPAGQVTPATCCIAQTTGCS